MYSLMGALCGFAVIMWLDAWWQRALAFLAGSLVITCAGLVIERGSLQFSAMPLAGAPVATIAQAVAARDATLLRLDRDVARRGCIDCMLRDCSGSSCWLNAEAACVAGNTIGGM